MLDEFIKSYADRAYKHTTMVRHQGTVLAFALATETMADTTVRPRIFYTVLDPAGAERDVDGWSTTVTEVPFPTEIAQVGFGAADPVRLPVYKKGSATPADPGVVVDHKQRDHFASTTARLGAATPFQTLSDGNHIYLLRQAIDTTDTNGHLIYTDDDGTLGVDPTNFTNPAPLVNGTLLVDRFVLQGDRLLNTREARFQRSRSRTRPQNEKDSLGASDLDGEPFVEPTWELSFVSGLHEGRFTAVIVPTQVVEIEKWHIFAHNPATELIDIYSVERSADGLFNTRGTQFYTSPDENHRKDVFEAKPGIDPHTGRDLVPVVDEGFSGSAVDLAPTGRITLGSGVDLESDPSAPPEEMIDFTMEAWIRPASGGGAVQLVVGDDSLTVDSDGRPAGTPSTAPSLWIEGGSRIGFGFGDGTSWYHGSSPSVLNPGEWAHVAVSHGDGTLRVHLGGSTAGEPVTVAADDDATLAPVTTIGSARLPFVGAVDEVRLWCRRRREDELVVDRHRRLTGREIGLVAYHRFDEAGGRTSHDQTDNKTHGTLSDDDMWITSDAPIGRGSGLQRVGFEVAARVNGADPLTLAVKSGLTAISYHQQSKVASGYDKAEKRLKQNARLMVAFATDGLTVGTEARNNIAVLDLAVSRSGDLTQLPNRVLLDQVNAKDATGQSINAQLDEIAADQAKIRRLEHEVAAIDREVAEKQPVHDTLATALDEPEEGLQQLPPGPYAHLNDELAAWADAQVPITLLRAEVARAEQWADEAQVVFYEHIHFNNDHDQTGPGVSLSAGVGIVDRARLEAAGLDDNISSIMLPASHSLLWPDPLEVTVFDEPGGTTGRSLLVTAPIPSLREDPPAPDTWNERISHAVVGLSSRFRARKQVVEAQIDQLLPETEPHGSTLRAARSALKTRLDALATSKNAKVGETGEIANLKRSIAAKSTLIRNGPSVTMPLAHTDAHGLTMSGGILGFAWTENTPRLADSAIGDLALYFRGAGNQFFATYFTTDTQRARYPLRSDQGDKAVVCEARAADLDMDRMVVSVSGSDFPDRCTVTVIGPEFEEEWRRVPRDPVLFAQVLNGEAGDRIPLGTGSLSRQDPVLVLDDGFTFAQELASGTTLMVGDRRVEVARPNAAGSNRVVVVGDVSLPEGSFPVFRLLYDYVANATTKRIPNDLYNGSLLVTAIEPEPTRLVVDQQVTSGATVTSNWTAAAPGSTLAFDGRTSYARPPAGHQLSRFGFDDDLTIETWARPDSAAATAADGGGAASIVHHRDGGRDYSLGLRQLPALHFSGNDRVDFGVVDPAPGSFTMELWFRCDNTTGERILYNKEDAYEAAVRSGFLEYAVRYQGTDTWTWLGGRSFPVTSGEWYHVAVVIDAEARLETVFRNGDPVFTRPIPNAVTSPAVLMSNTVLRAGARGKDTVRSHFVGSLAEMRAWGAARTTDQIRSGMWRPAGAVGSGLVGAWTFDSVEHVTDLSPNDHDGDVVGDPTTDVVSHPFVGVEGTWVAGRTVIKPEAWTHLAARYGRSFGVYFDDAEAHLDAGDQQSLNLDNDLTIDVTVILDPGFNSGVRGWSGLLAKGGPGRGLDYSPYMLGLSWDGRIVFGFESADGADSWFWSSENASHRVTPGKPKRISVRRRKKTRTVQTGDTSTFTLGWFEIDFFLNGKKIGDTGYYEVDSRLRDEVNKVTDTTDPAATKAALEAVLIDENDDNGELPTSLEPKRIGRTSESLTLGRSHIPGSTFGVGLAGASLTRVDIWNRALDALDPGDTEGLAARWRFPEREGTRTADSVGQSHATFSGNVRWVQDPDPGNSSLTLLIDGVEVDTDGLDTDDDAASNSAPFGSTLDQFTIGATHVKVGTANRFINHFAGQLEETRLWTTVRTDEQIRDNMFRRLTGETEDLAAHYTYDVDTELSQTPLTIGDGSFRANTLEVHDADLILSTAPIGVDTPQVRSALAGVRTAYHTAHGAISTQPAMAEYADLQYDATGAMIGSFKRCYSVIDGTAWRLITGFKVGDLDTEWVGQVQYAPQLIGFIEGAPPVPSENLTTTGYVRGEFNDYVGAAAVELTMADDAVYRYSAAKDTGVDRNVDFKIGPMFGAKAEVGMFFSAETVKVENVIGGQGRFEWSYSWLHDAGVAAKRSTTKNTRMELKGSVENVDALAHPAMGRRFVPDNVGMALVVSETADVFAMRLRHNGALISYQMRPNTDVPADRNIITFPINPRYTKQGVLDGKVGEEPDPNYPNAKTYSSDVSYFKPIEAYSWKKDIERESAALARFYGGYDAAAAGRAGMPFGEDLEKGQRLDEDIVEGWGTTRKRNLVNTYVWTADGGLYAEEESALDEVTEVIGGAHQYLGQGGAFLDFTFGVLGIGVKLEANALFGGHFKRSVTKGSEATTSFGLTVDLGGLDGDIYLRDETNELDMDLRDSRNPVPKRMPGRVDAYRFMSFYREPKADHFDVFFNKVVDPIWLEQSNSANAAALRQARQDGKRPPCWRIVHRVTYVSRVLSETDATPAGSLERDLRELDIDSNYELIRQLEPLVGHLAESRGKLNDAVYNALDRHFPELLPHLVPIQQYLSDYLGVAGAAGGPTGALGFGDDPLAGRAVNRPPVVNAGQDQIIGLDGASRTTRLEAEAFDDRYSHPGRLFTTWSFGDEPPAGHQPVIADTFARKTDVAFTARGRYRFEFRASDGELAATDHVDVVVNEPPVVTAAEQITVGNTSIADILADAALDPDERDWLEDRVVASNPIGAVRLQSVLTDSGLGDPETGVVNVTWTDRTAGAGGVTFRSTSSLNTLATFAKPGYYRLRVQVDNGSFQRSVTLAVAVSTRTREGLEALYTFRDGAGSTVHDVSGTGTAIDLRITDSRAVTWIPSGGDAGLRIDRPTSLIAIGSVGSLVDDVRIFGEMTLEAWVTPTASDTDGLARILTISSGSDSRNVLLGQQGTSHHGAVRTSSTTANAADRAVGAGPVSAGTATHLVLRRDSSGTVALLVDGEVAASRVGGGDLGVWDPTFDLVIGHEVGHDSVDAGWLGTLHLVAVYSKALDDDTVRQHRDFGYDRNMPPMIAVGPTKEENSETLPVTIELHPASIVHDRPPSPSRVEWFKVAGPGTVSIDNLGDPQSATFDAPGRHVLRLEVGDGELTADDELTILIRTKPAIRITTTGTDNGEVSVPGQVVLQGEILDIGRSDPPPAIAITWRQTGGPSRPLTGDDTLEATVDFATADAGEYAFSLTVDNGIFETVETVVVWANVAPSVQASAPSTVTEADSGSTAVELNGSVDHDGLGRTDLDPSPSTVQWSHESGPGEVVFEPSETVESPTVLFSRNGVHGLRFVADNGRLSASTTVTVTVNRKPVVTAGPNRIATVGRPLVLDGAVIDDGLPQPPRGADMTWTVVEGPAPVALVDLDGDRVSATFGQPGRYRLAFAAGDGAETTSDETVVEVTAEPLFVVPPEQLLALPETGSVSGTLEARFDSGQLPGVTLLDSLWLPTDGLTADVIADPTELATTVTLDEPGRRRFQLTARVRVDGVDDPFIATAEAAMVATRHPADGLELLYSFDDPTGSEAVLDGIGPAAVPLQVRAGVPTVGGGALTLGAGAYVATGQRVATLVEHLTDANAFTLEAWVTPLEPQAGEGEPFRIVTISADSQHRNLTLGQTSDGNYDVRLRTISTNRNGTSKTVRGGQVGIGDLTHLVVTWTGTVERVALFVNGVAVADVVLGGGLSAYRGTIRDPASWDLDYHLALGDELTEHRQWVGRIHSVAFYNRAWTAAEVAAAHRLGS